MQAQPTLRSYGGYDDPQQALPLKIGEEHRRKFFVENARAVYRVR